MLKLMTPSPSPSHFLRFSLALIVFSLSVILAWPVQAQYINPSGLPPGGRSASWLDTSGQSQLKLGSLLIGDYGFPQPLCLNGSSGTACVSSWTEAANGVGGPFVRVFQDQIISPEIRESGFVRLVGNDNRPTVISDADPGTGTKSGIYSYAAYQDGFSGAFSGRVRIISDTAGSLGQLCLNSTNLYPDTVFFNVSERYDFGCIEHWSDLQNTAIGSYIKVQAANPPVLQVGTGWLGDGPGAPAVLPGAWQFGSVVVGGVSSNPPVASYRGDGLCSPEIGEVSPNC